MRKAVKQLLILLGTGQNERPILAKHATLFILIDLLKFTPVLRPDHANYEWAMNL